MIKQPITFNSDGTMRTIQEGTDEYYAALFSNTLRIEAGELPISTFYGITDPAFERDATALNYARQAAQFVPEISITEANYQVNDDESVNMGIKFTIDSGR